MPSLDSLPTELLALIIAHLNAHPAPRALLVPDIPRGEEWKTERLLFAMLFNYCICEHCAPDIYASSPRASPSPAESGDVGVFPLPVKDAVNALSSVSRRMRAVTMDASRARSVMHRFEDIERTLRADTGGKKKDVKKTAPVIPKITVPKTQLTKTAAPNNPKATTLTPKPTKPPAKPPSAPPRRPRRFSMSSTHASDGTRIVYTFTTEHAEVLKPGWERHLHGILYPDEHRGVFTNRAEAKTGAQVGARQGKEWPEIKHAVRYPADQDAKDEARFVPRKEEEADAARLKEERRTRGPTTLPSRTTATTAESPWTADAGAHDSVRNLVIGFHHKSPRRPAPAGTPPAAAWTVDFLRQYPALQALLIDWYFLPSADAPPDPPKVTCDTLERLDIRLHDGPHARACDGLPLARQLTGLVRRLEVPRLKTFQLIHRMPEGREYVRANWEVIMAGLMEVKGDQVEVVKVSLWLGGGLQRQPFWLWKTALRDLLAHAFTLHKQPKIVLCLFYDIHEFDDLLFPMDRASGPALRPSLAPTREAMHKFIKDHVVPGTGDFDLVVHAAPAEDEAFGADRPHVPLVTVSYRAAAPSGNLDFKLDGDAIRRLAAEVSAWSGEDEQDRRMHAAFHQMAMHIERDPQLRSQMRAFGL